MKKGLYSEENLIDKVAFYSDALEKWFVGKQGFADYIEITGSLRTHGVKEPYFDELESFTFQPETGEFVLEDKSGRTRNFNESKYKIKLREAL
jgi:hypothetical protein